jgi:fatty acid synthase subunit alpha
MSEMMITNSLVKIKEAPPYSPELEAPVLLNSLARAELNAKTGQYAFTSKLETKASLDLANVKAVSQILSETGATAGVGVDQGTLIYGLFPASSQLT